MSGAEECAVNMASIDQSSKIAFTAPPEESDGILYAAAPVNALRMSKSELPRAMFGFCVWHVNQAPRLPVVFKTAIELAASQREDGVRSAHGPERARRERPAATCRRETKVFEDGIRPMHLNCLLAFEGIIASRDAIPLIERGKIIGAIGFSGDTDSQDEVVRT